MRANWVTVTLPNGLTLGGEIIQAAPVATGVGGVITFNAHVRDLGL